MFKLCKLTHFSYGYLIKICQGINKWIVKLGVLNSLHYAWVVPTKSKNYFYECAICNNTLDISTFFLETPYWWGTALKWSNLHDI